MGDRSRRLLGAVVVVALLLAVGGAVALLRARPEPVAAALDVLDDDDRFRTAVDASDAFAEVSGQLGEVECDAARDDECARMHRASAWAQVTAVRIVRCAPSAVFEARADLARYMRQGGALPAVPRCGERRQAVSS